MTTLKYYDADVSLLLRGFPYAQMCGYGFERFLRRKVDALSCSAYLLERYPEREYTELAFFYSSRKALDAFNTDLLHDLFSGTWREASLAVWLICLDPLPDYEDMLRANKPLHPMLQQMFAIALSNYGEPLPSDLATERDRLNIVRCVILSLQQRARPLRLAPQGETLLQLNTQMDMVRVAYKNLGADQVLPLTKSGVFQYYAQPYSEWLRNGALTWNAEQTTSASSTSI